MRLAFVTPRFALEGVVGGAETLIRDLAHTAVDAGHDVHLLTTCAIDHHSWTNVRDPGEETVEGIQVHYFSVNEDRDVERFLRIQHDIDHSRPISRADEETWAANSVCSRTLCDWVREHGGEFDALLAGPYLFGITLEVAGLHPDRTWLIPCLHDEPFATLSIMKDLFRSVKGCLFNSVPEKALAERLCNLPPDRGHVVGMALDPFEADPKAFALRHHLETPYVLYCGRQEAGKNTPLLLAYLDTYVQRRPGRVSLVMTGSGNVPVPEVLRSCCKNLGFVSVREKHEAMAGAAVFIHPSLNESFGIVLMEAWLARTSGLVHAQGEVLRWQCAAANAGLWFRDYADFETMLDRLLDDPVLNTRLGANGRKYVMDHYTRNAIADRLFNALETQI